MGQIAKQWTPSGVAVCIIWTLVHTFCLAESTWHHGCYELEDNRIIDPGSHDGSAKSFNGSISLCSKRCKQLGSDLIGIQDVTCACLTSKDDISPLPPSSCNNRCQDTPDSNLHCGGSGAWSVYNTSGPYLVQVRADTESRWLEAGLPVKMEVAVVLDTFVDSDKELTPATEWKNVLEFVCRAGMTVEARVNISMNGTQEYTVCSLTFPRAGNYDVEVTARNFMSSQTIIVPLRILTPKPRLVQVSPLNPSWTLPSCTPPIGEHLDKVIRESRPSLDDLISEKRRDSNWDNKDGDYDHGVPENDNTIPDFFMMVNDEQDVNGNARHGANRFRSSHKSSWPVISVFVNQTLKLEMSVATGINLTFGLLLWNGTDWDSFEQRPSDTGCGHNPLGAGGAGCKQGVQDIFIGRTGIYPAVVLVHNKLGMVQANITIVAVDEDIGDMSVTTPNMDSNVVQTLEDVLLFRLTAVTILRQSTSIQVDFGDGVVKSALVREKEATNTTRAKRALPTLFGSYGEGCNLSLEFDYDYRKQGVFRPLVKLSNNFTSKTIYSDEIIALNAISGVRILTDKFVVKDEEVEFSLEFQTHSINMTAIWSISDEDGNIILNQLVKSFEMSGLEALSITTIFPQIGRYKIQVEVSNLLMKQLEHAYVMVQERSSGLTMTCNKGQYIQVEDDVECEARIASGTDLNFVWIFQRESGTSSSSAEIQTYNWNDTTSETHCTMDKDDAGNVLRIRHCFDHHGTYNITITASNEVSSSTFLLPYSIEVQLPVGCLDVDMKSSTTPNTHSNIVVTSYEGTGLYFDLDINGGGRVKIDPEKTEVIGDITIFSSPMVFPKADLYTVSVYAYNEVSSTSKSVDVHVQKPVPPFSIRVMKQPSPSPITFIVESISGELLHSSNLVYAFHFPDGHTHVTQVPVVAVDIRKRLGSVDNLDVYKENGRRSYPVRVKVYNDASSQINTTILDVKDKDLRLWDRQGRKKQQKGRTKSKRRRGRTRTNRPVFSHQTFIRLGERAHFSLEIGNSTSKSLQVDYGDGSNEKVDCQGQSCDWSRAFQKIGVFHIRLSFLGKGASSYASSPSRKAAARSSSSSSSLDPRWLPTLVQSVLVVEQPITGLRIEGPRNAEIHCNHEWKVVFETGSNVLLVWTLDGIDDSPTTIQKFYTAARDREHSLKVRAFNDISQAETSIEIFAKHPLKAVHVKMPPAMLDTPLNITIQVQSYGPNFNVSCDFGHGDTKLVVINDMLVSNNPVDERGDVFHVSEDSFLKYSGVYPVEFHDIYEEPRTYELNMQHTYTEPGNYTVTVDVDNGLSVITRTKKLTVEERIGEINLRANHESVMSINEKLTVTAEVSSGKNLQFRWDFSDIIQPTVTSDGRVSTATHMFSISKSYTVKVNVTSPNQPEGVIQMLPNKIHVLEPVTETIIVQKVPAQGIKGVAPLDQRVVFAARSYGSYVFFTFDFGDGSRTTVEGTSGVMPWPGATVSHTYKKVGMYTVSVLAWNDLNSEQAFLADPFVVQVPVTGLELQASTCVHYPETAVFKASVTSGTNVTFEWRMNDQSQWIKGGSSKEHAYNSIGKKTIGVRASNLVTDPITDSIDIDVVAYITSVKLTPENDTVIAGESTTYQASVTPQNASVGAVYTWLLHPSTSFMMSRQSMFQHKHTISGRQRVKVTAKNCLGSESDSVEVHVVARLQGLSIDIKGDIILGRPVLMTARYWSGDSLVLTWDFGNGSSPVVVNNTFVSSSGANNTVRPIFNSIGEYIVTLKAENAVSNDEVTKKIFILDKPCEPPEVKIQGVWIPGQDSRELNFYKSEPVEVEAMAKVNCIISSQIRFKWEIKEALSHEEVFLDEATYREMKYPNLLLPPGTLSPGLYTFAVRVDMDGTEIPVYANSSARVRISTSPLYVTVKGGIYRTVGRNGLVVMDASWSRDLDDPETELGYSWTCKPLDFVPTKENGCFNTSMEEFLNHNNQSLWVFPARLLRTDVVEFVFNVSVWRLSEGHAEEDGRESQTSADQVIFVDSEPREVLPLWIECVQCWRHNVNMEHKVSLRAQCKGCQQRGTTYHWELSELFYQDQDWNYFDGDPMVCVNPNGTLMMMVREQEGNKTVTVLKTYSKESSDNSTTGSEKSQLVIKTTEAPVVRTDTSKEIDKDEYWPHIVEADSRHLHRPNPIGFINVEEGGKAGQTRSMGRMIDDPIEMPGFGRDLNEGKANPLTTKSPPEAACDKTDDCVRPIVDLQSRPPPHLVSMRRILSGLAEDQTLTGLDQPSLVIKPGVLRQGTTYLVKVNAVDKDGSLSTAMTYFQVNRSPRKGKCTLKPHAGTSMDTVFSFYCNEWRDEHTPMRFEVSYHIKGSSPEESPQIVYRGLRHNVKFQLPAGLPEHGYEVVASITVLDRFLARTPICEDTLVVRPRVQKFFPGLGVVHEGRPGSGRNHGRRGGNRGSRGNRADHLDGAPPRPRDTQSSAGRRGNDRRSDAEYLADSRLLNETYDTRQMVSQSVYDGAVVPDFVAMLRQLIHTLNDDAKTRPYPDDHQHRVGSPRSLARQTVVDTLKWLPLRNQLEMVQVLRCLSDAVKVTRELNEITITNAVYLLEDITSRAKTQLKYDKQGMNFDLDPHLLTLTVTTASGLMTVLAGSDTLFEHMDDRDEFYKKRSKAITSCVNDMVALQMQLQSVGEVPIHITTSFLSIHAYQLNTGLQKPVKLEDVQFQLPNVTDSLLQHWFPSAENSYESTYSARNNEKSIEQFGNKGGSDEDNVNKNRGNARQRHYSKSNKNINYNDGNIYEPSTGNSNGIENGDETGTHHTLNNNARLNNANNNFNDNFNANDDKRTDNSLSQTGNSIKDRNEQPDSIDDSRRGQDNSKHRGRTRSSPNQGHGLWADMTRSGHRFVRDEDCFQSIALSFKSDPNMLMPRTAGKVQTAVASLDLYSCDGSEHLDVKDLSKSDLVRIDIHRKQANESSYHGYPHYLSKTDMNVHELMPGGERGPLLGRSGYPTIDRQLYIHIKLEPVQIGQQGFPLLVLISHKSVPYNSHNFVFKKVFNASEHDIKIILPLSSIKAGKTYSVGLAEASYNSGRRRSFEVKGMRYNLSAWWDTCVYWNEKEQRWQNDGCQVLESSTLQNLHCSCSHLTTFGGFFDFIPHQLNVFNVNEFFSPHESPLIVVLVGVVLLTFGAMVLLIRPSLGDREDFGRVVFLQDHCPNHHQKYEVIMETGFHPDSGTTSKISLILHGDEGVSETRELTVADNITLFERNSRNRFIITLPESPGRISKIQMWHNNSGDSPGWFIRQAVVRDLTTGQAFYFLCQRWLAVDRDDGKVEREFSVLDASAMRFSQVFVCKGCQYLSDLHTWFSVFTCPPNSNFTHSQRLFLCLATLMAYMGLATVWFHLMPPAIRGEFGLLDLSWVNMVTGCAICCCMFPLVHFLAFVFRRSCASAESASKPSEGGCSKSANGKSGLDLTSQGDEDNTNMAPAGSVPYSILDQSILNWQHIQEWAHRQWQKRQMHIISNTDAIKDAAQAGQHQSTPSMVHLVQQTMLAGDDDVELGSSGFEDATSQATAERNRIFAASDTSSLGKKSDSDHSSSSSSTPHRTLLLPSGCRYIAWVVCFLLTGSGAAVTAWYGFRFSHRRSVMWIQTVYSSLITSIFILQPLVILLKTMWISLRHRHNPAVFDLDRELDDDLDLDWEERKYHEMNAWHEEDEMQKGLAARSRSRYLRFAGPIQEKQLKSSRRKMLKEKKAFTLFRLGCILTVLTLLLVILTFGRNRSYQVQLQQAAHQMFAGSTENEFSFVNLKSISDWHWWSKQEFVASLATLETLTKETRKNYSSELGMVIGDIQLRQFKVKPQPCVHLRPLATSDAWCLHDYAKGNEESYDDFGMWQMGSPPGLWGRLAWYGGDGYVLPISTDSYNLLNVLDMLENSKWLDDRTRAVSIEMTIYNPPSRLFSSVILLMEVSASGRVIPSVHIRSSQLFHYVTLWEDCLLACELMFLVFTIVILSHTAHKMFNQRRAYFNQFWNCIEMVMSLSSMLYIVLYLYRFVIVMGTVEALRSTFYENFVSFALLTLWDEILHTVLGIMLFCVMLQWIRVCSYNPTIARLVSVYKKSRREIALAAGLFAGQLLAFSSLGHAVFGYAYKPMHSFLSTAMTVTALSARIFSNTDTGDVTDFYTVSVFFLFVFVFLHGILSVYIFCVLSYTLKGTKMKMRLSMPPKKLLQFYWHYIWERTQPKRYQPTQESENTLSPEFIMAEILYLVDELLFRMNNLLGTSGLPEKQHSFSDSDSVPDVEDDGISMGGSDELHNIHAHLVNNDGYDIPDCNRLEDRVHRIEDKLCSNEPYLAQLLKLNSFGANILSEEEEQELRSQLEYEIFQQLQKQRQETSDVNYATCCPQTKAKLESPKVTNALMSNREIKDATVAVAPKVLNNKPAAKQMNTPDTPHLKLHSPKRITEIISPEFFPDVDTKATMKSNPPSFAMNTKSLKRSQSLKVPVRDTMGIFDMSPQGFKKSRQGCIVENDLESGPQTKMLVNRHSSVKGKKEMLAFDCRLGKKHTITHPKIISSNSNTTNSVFRRSAGPSRSGESNTESEKEQTLSLSHKSSSGNVSPQSSSEGERGHKRSDSSSGQSGADTRLDTPKMLGKRLDLPPRPTFSHSATNNLSPHKGRPLDLVTGGELAAAESSSGSEQEAVLGGHKRMSSIGRRNLRKTKSRGKGKGDDVDINSAIVLSEDFHPTGRHGGFSDCSIIIHPVPANVDLDEISIPEEL